MAVCRMQSRDAENFAMILKSRNWWNPGYSIMCVLKILRSAQSSSQFCPFGICWDSFNFVQGKLLKRAAVSSWTPNLNHFARKFWAGPEKREPRAGKGLQKWYSLSFFNFPLSPSFCFNATQCSATVILAFFQKKWCKRQLCSPAKVWHLIAHSHDYSLGHSLVLSSVSEKGGWLSVKGYLVVSPV